LCPELNNGWFKKQVQFFTDWCLSSTSEPFWMEKGKVYEIETLYMTRPYHNLTEDGNNFFSRVIEKVNRSITFLPKHDTICMIKFINSTNLTNDRAFRHSNKMSLFLRQHGIVLKQPEDMSESEKIYYLYNAKNVILTWGATSHINFVMICGNMPRNQEKKNVLFLAHEAYANEYIEVEYICYAFLKK
jgi:hypothetical protein